MISDASEPNKENPTQSKPAHGSHLELPLDHDPERGLVQVDTDTGMKYLTAVSPTGEVVRSPIDGEWVQAAIRFKWSPTKNKRGEYTYFYSNGVRNGKGEAISLHRLVYRLRNGRIPGKPVVIDHKDGDPLNNLQDNLRAVPKVVNIFNSPYFAREFPGIARDKESGRWSCWITSDKTKTVIRDDFESKADAAIALYAALTETYPEADWHLIPTEELFPDLAGESTSG